MLLIALAVSPSGRFSIYAHRRGIDSRTAPKAVASTTIKSATETGPKSTAFIPREAARVVVNRRGNRRERDSQRNAQGRPCSAKRLERRTRRPANTGISLS